MKCIGYFLIIFFFVNVLLVAQSSDSDACTSCHQEIDQDMDTPVMENILNDVHIEKGLGCTGCHGGDPEAFDDPNAAMWDNKSFRGKIAKADQPQLCGKCHSDPQFMRDYSVSIQTDQVSQYWSSMHGTELKKGNKKVAVCTDCHGVHGIYHIKDPRAGVYPLNVPATCSKCHSDAGYMAEFGIPTDQFYQYRNSVHGQALLDQLDIGAPACNDCHGNHGALPPNVVHITDICGLCHVNNNNLFQKSHLKNIFLARGFGQCKACHGDHGIVKPGDRFLDWDHGAVCVQCHQDAGNPKKLAGDFYQIIDTLKKRIELAGSLISTAEQKGMEVSDLFFPLEEANKVLIQTRTSIHSFNKEFVEKTAKGGYDATDQVIEGANLALKEYNVRRKWLFVLSLIITFLAITLYVKIKDIDKRDKLN